MKSLFITFEGIEGSGKTTIVKMLYEELRKKGYSVLSTFEPGDHALGVAIRKILLNPAHPPSLLGELLLYMADRAEHIEKVIKPALEKNEIVLCDRFIDSTVAYQGFGRGIDINMINTLNDIVRNNLRPDRTYLLDIEPEVGLNRNAFTEKLDRFEMESIEFHRRVREGYLTIAKQEPERIKIIDASRPIEKVFAEIKEDVFSLII